MILSTRNRSALLGSAIISLLRCDAGGGAYEFVIVDNGSTDDTAEIVAGLIHDDPDRQLRYVFEGRLGLHHARHAGARAARSQLLLFTDDDVEVEPDWVSAYVAAFAAHPEMVAAGGPAIPRWETDPPAWVTELVSSSWFCLPLGLIDRGSEFLLAPVGDFFGLNMAVRADALRRFGGFRPEMIGSAIVGSGEWGLQMAMQRAGALIGWVPGARLSHRVPRSRMQPRYFERWVRFESSSLMFERWHLAPRSVRTLARDLARIVRTNWRSWLRGASVRRAPDAPAIQVRSQALRGVYEIAYLWMIVRRPDVRAFLDAERFGP